MNIDLVKVKLRNYVNTKHVFIYKGARNQNERFTGVITKLFPGVFIIKCEDGSIKAFSYSDYLIGNLKIVI